MLGKDDAADRSCEDRPEAADKDDRNRRHIEGRKDGDEIRCQHGWGDGCQRKDDRLQILVYFWIAADEHTKEYPQYQCSEVSGDEQLHRADDAGPDFCTGINHLGDDLGESWEKHLIQASCHIGSQLIQQEGHHYDQDRSAVAA